MIIVFASSCLRWSPKEEHSMQTALGKQLCDNIVPVMVDATMEYLSEQCSTILERVVGPADSDQFANCIQSYVLSKCHKLLVDQLGADRYVFLRVLTKQFIDNCHLGHLYYTIHWSTLFWSLYIYERHALTGFCVCNCMFTHVLAKSKKLLLHVIPFLTQYKADYLKKLQWLVQVIYIYT